MSKTITTLRVRRLDHEFRELERHEQLSRSWLKHFFDLFYINLAFATNSLAGVNDVGSTPRNLVASIKDPPCGLNVFSTAGGTLQVPLSTNGPSTWANLGILYDGSWYGIQVGSNATPVTPLNDALNTRIAHGVAAGTLMYSGGTEVYDIAFADPNGSFKIRRYFTNHSLGDVTVRETGIYSPGEYSDRTVERFCICRDVPVAVTVHDTELLEVVYTINITV